MFQLFLVDENIQSELKCRQQADKNQNSHLFERKLRS